MTATTTAPALVATDAVFSGPGRLALSCFVVGHSGLTCESYALDLRQFPTWRGRHDFHLLDVRRAGGQGDIQAGVNGVIEVRAQGAGRTSRGLGRWRSRSP